MLSIYFPNSVIMGPSLFVLVLSFLPGYVATDTYDIQVLKAENLKLRKFAIHEVCVLMR